LIYFEALTQKNKEKAGVNNVAFLKGRIEQIPLPADSVDVVISNCVINLAPDKSLVLNDAFHVLRPEDALRWQTSCRRGRFQTSCDRTWKPGSAVSPAREPSPCLTSRRIESRGERGAIPSAL
jgi:ubiquinone/menaquinone biosynthesis C-methylase UbiE